jgi:dihydroorotase
MPLQKLGMLLLVHGEVTRSEVDIFDREAVFIDEVLAQVTSDFNLSIAPAWSNACA